MLQKFKSIIIKYRNLIISFISLVIFLLIAEDIFEKEIISYDVWAYNVLVENWRSDFLTMIMKIITNLGSVFVLVPVSLLFFVFSKNKRKGICATINLLLITFINTVLKLIVQRARPSGFNIITEVGYSFPSGHSMVSTAFYGFLIYLAYKNIKNKVLRNIMCVSLFLLIILICISRVYLGVHYASDVIGGFLFPFLTLCYLL